MPPPPTVLLQMCYQNFPSTTPFPSQDLSGQTIIVTGSNTGLGLEAARHMARLNAAHVILAVRSLEKGAAARDSILASTQRAPDAVSVWELDMASFASIRAFAARAAALPRLDAAVLNAGLATRHLARSADGWELSLAVNVLGTALLALRLLPKLVASGRAAAAVPRLVVVSSGVHAWVDVRAARDRPNTLATLNDAAWCAETGAMAERYPTSKLMDVFLTREIAELVLREAPGRVVVNTVDPGLCHSELATREDTWAFWALRQVFARPTETGSRTLVHAATAGLDSHGQYLSNSAVAQPGPFVKSEQGRVLQKKVWREMLEVLADVDEVAKDVLEGRPLLK